jgi:hypothetical protein
MRVSVNGKWVAATAIGCLTVTGLVGTARHGKAQVTNVPMMYLFAPIGVAHGQRAQICYTNTSKTSMQVQVSFIDALTGKVFISGNNTVPPNAGICPAFANTSAGEKGERIEVVGFVTCNGIVDSTHPDLISLEIVDNSTERTTVIANPPLEVGAQK